jgi:hypothetical protein
MVGEVWICSGQSNMEYPVLSTGNKFWGLPDGEKVMHDGDAGIRFMQVPRVVCPDGPCAEPPGNIRWMRGDGTDGHFLGLKEGMLMLSAVLPLEGLDADEFGRRMLVLAAASHRVADALSHASADGAGPAAARQDPGGKDFMRV